MDLHTLEDDTHTHPCCQVTRATQKKGNGPQMKKDPHIDTPARVLICKSKSNMLCVLFTCVLIIPQFDPCVNANLTISA